MNKLETATFAAGCFWGVEDTFMKLPGVKETMVGYSGGKIEDPTYEDVGTDRTGHAESIQLKYDPSEISYAELLKVFWDNHDPTTLNRQGPDTGTQYRSAIFYHSLEQKISAKKSKEELEKSGKWNKPIVTEITKISPFYKAEEYHQKYYKKNPGKKVC